MDLTLFIVFTAISLVITIIGLIKPEHTELAMVGFIFLFLLSMVILTNGLQYQTGITTIIYNTGNYSI